MTTYWEFGQTLVDTLRDAQAPDGRLHDPVTREPVSADQYAGTTFAVAAFRVAARTGNKKYREAGERAVTEFLERAPSERGHGEFNTFALLEMIRDAEAGRYDLPVGKRRLRKIMSFEATPYSSHGNNFLLLQALCRYERSMLFGSALNRLRARRLLFISRRWQSPDGYLVDQHRLPIPPSESPLVYHAKQTMCLGRLATLGLTRCAPLHRDGLQVLATVGLESGEALYYGRSENTIFGYASLLDSVERFLTKRSEAPDWAVGLRDRTWLYVMSAFDPTVGSCLPSCGDAEGQPIDDYVNHGVYSAYAAMLLLDLSPTREGSQRSHGASEYCSDAPAGHPGVFRLEGADSALGFATEGEAKFTKGIPDPRYAGMIPQTFTHLEQSIIPGIPVDFATRLDMPFLPVITGGQPFSPTVWQSTIEPNSDATIVTGRASYHHHRKIAPEEDAPEVTDTSVGSKVKNAIRCGAERSRLVLLYELWKKRPLETDLETRRSIWYLRDQDVLIIQTDVLPQTEACTYLPSSYVVTPDTAGNIIHRASFTTTPTTHKTRTHKGKAIWTTFSQTNVPPGDVSTHVLAFDPGSNLVDLTLTDVSGQRELCVVTDEEDYVRAWDPATRRWRLR